jgi:coenzyme F420-0:L-glutamate ligase/coenzyme F420-1:gamma-L-glutamate ligase
VTSLAILPISLAEEITEGADLASCILKAAVLADGDVVVVTQKIVSKAEGRVVNLAEGDEEGFLALVHSESARVLRRRGTLAITETHHGFICANAGIDRSNTRAGTVVLLPRDPDASARRIRIALERATGCRLAVVVTDTFGRTFRNGVTDVAIGCAGLRPILDLRGTRDHTGRPLTATEVCIADEVAAAADLVKTKGGRTPVVIVRGLDPQLLGEGSVKDEVVRDYSRDLFR